MEDCFREWFDNRHREEFSHPWWGAAGEKPQDALERLVDDLVVYADERLLEIERKIDERLRDQPRP